MANSFIPTRVYNAQYNGSLRMPGLFKSSVPRANITNLSKDSNAFDTRTTLIPKEQSQWNNAVFNKFVPDSGETSTDNKGMRQLRGKYQQPSSGNNEDASSARFQIIKPGELPNLRPVLDVLNYELANRFIDKIKTTQLARKNMYYSTPSLSVRPVTDLPPEVLAAQADALSQVRSTDASSDPAMNLISKNMAGAQRGKMRNEQIAGRATALLQDRNRFDEQQRANQQAAAETENKNLDRAQDFADYKTGVNTAALEAKKDLTSGFISNVGKNMGTAAEFNLEQLAIKDFNKRQDYNDDMKLAMSYTDEGTRAGKVQAVRDKYAQYAAAPELNYNQAMAQGAAGTFIGKLLTGTLGGR